jgi:hypothetical protein
MVETLIPINPLAIENRDPVRNIIANSVENKNRIRMVNPITKGARILY